MGMMNIAIAAILLCICMVTATPMDVDDPAEFRINLRATSPAKAIFSKFETFDYSADIAEHKKFVKDLSSSPQHALEKTRELRERLDRDGPSASFPELKGVVSYLTKELFQTDPVKTACQKNPIVATWREVIGHTLASIQMETKGFPYYPYSETIHLIEQMIQLLDAVIRNEPGSTYFNYYHNFRYRMYLSFLLTETGRRGSDYVVFPTIAYLSPTALITTRCAPIMFLGVTNKPTHADGYKNTPLDFWAHDIQHMRRQFQENERYYDIFVRNKNYFKARSPYDVITRGQFYEQMCSDATEIITHISTAPEDSVEVSNVQKLKKMLVFEVVHEKAWPITKMSLKRNIQLGYDVFPIETVKVLPSYPFTFTIIYDAFNDPTTLANLYLKLTTGFYDDVSNPNQKMVLADYRTINFVVRAASELLKDLGVASPDKDLLKALTQSEKNADEFVTIPGANLFLKGKEEIDQSLFTRFPIEDAPQCMCGNEFD